MQFVDPSGLAGMVVIFNRYQVETGFGFKAPLGHAGVVAIDNETGVASYYEFGRYGGEYGNVCQRDDISTLVPIDVGSFTEESMANLREELKALNGNQYELTTITNINADAQLINEFVNSRIGNEEHYPYTLNPFSKKPMNYCYTFAFDALGAGL